METWKSAEEILDFAISEEEKAAEFYTELAMKAGHRHMRDVFLQFAEEEKAHRAKLQEAKRGKKFKPAGKDVIDLKIADYTADVSTENIENFQDALVVAMKKEKAACRLYTSLARIADTPHAKELFLALAREEAKHKLRFETEYDDTLREN